MLEHEGMLAGTTPMATSPAIRVAALDEAMDEAMDGLQWALRSFCLDDGRSAPVLPLAERGRMERKTSEECGLGQAVGTTGGIRMVKQMYPRHHAMLLLMVKLD